MSVSFDVLKNVEPNIPCFCFDKDRFCENLRKFKVLLSSDVQLLYSIKANPFFVETAKAHLDGIEVCSSGEIFLASSYNVEPLKITFGGICKEETDFEYAIKFGIRRFSIESLSQLSMLNDVAVRYNVSVNALLRISVGNQFGMSLDGINKCFNDYCLSHVEILGFHYYPGTMRITSKEIKDDYDKFISILNLIDTSSIKEIQYGAGIGVDYYGDRELNSTIECTAKIINDLAKKYKITYEAGRMLAADAGVYISRVVEKKKSGEKNFLILNGGRHHFTYHGGVTSLGKRRPHITIISNSPIDKTENSVVVGALCNAGDILANDIELPIVETGDYIVFHKAGAYCMTEGSTLFLSRDIPAIFNICDGELKIIREKNSINWLQTFYAEGQA